MAKRHDEEPEKAPSMLDRMNIPLKTVVAIVFWVASMVGVYYTMKAKLDEVQSKADKLEQRLDKYNPEVLDYKVTAIQNQIKEIDGKTDRIQQLLTR